VANRVVEVADGLLREIAEPDAFYAAAAASGAQGSGVRPVQAARPVAAEPDGDEEALLTRILELEALLEADRARKTKFQKPERQAAWKAELDRLNERLAGA
jgi:hypothetical protein